MKIQRLLSIVFIVALATIAKEVVINSGIFFLILIALFSALLWWTFLSQKDSYRGQPIPFENLPKGLFSSLASYQLSKEGEFVHVLKDSKGEIILAKLPVEEVLGEFQVFKGRLIGFVPLNR